MTKPPADGLQEALLWYDTVGSTWMDKRALHMLVPIIEAARHAAPAGEKNMEDAEKSVNAHSPDGNDTRNHDDMPGHLPPTSTPAPAEPKLETIIGIIKRYEEPDEAAHEIMDLFLPIKAVTKSVSTAERQAAGEGVELRDAARKFVDQIDEWRRYQDNHPLGGSNMYIDSRSGMAQTLYDAAKQILEPRTQGAAVDVEALKREVHEKCPNGFYATKCEVIDYLAAQGHLPAPSSEKGQKK